MAITERTFHFLFIRATNVRMRPNRGILHGAGLTFKSLSVYLSLFLAEKDGRLLDIRRILRVKKPWFCVEKDG